MNRIQVGAQTEKDMDILATRVRPKKHEDLRDKDALWLFGKNNPVDAVNTIRLLKIKGKELKENVKKQVNKFRAKK